MKKMLSLLILVILSVPVFAQVAGYGQCAGIGYPGQTTCVDGFTCSYVSDYYSQCLPGSGGGTTYTCPNHPCSAGGCGSAACTITQDYPGGLGSSKSVTAQSGYYACCWKDSSLNLNAGSYSNKCCTK